MNLDDLVADNGIYGNKNIAQIFHVTNVETRALNDSHMTFKTVRSR